MFPNSSNPSPAAEPVGGLARWPWELGLLLLLTAAIHGARLTDLTLRGEETRRARIAVEMAEADDWIVPRQQGLPFLSRPPLQNWAIALAGWCRGDVDAAAIRLPSLLAVLLLAGLIWAYGRTFLSRAGAFTAGASFVTAAQVLELGPLGETDTLFTLLVAGSLLVWHLGLVRGWPMVCTWSAGYALAALGTLAKGPQAPVYFVAAVGVFLLVTRRWRMLLAWPHLVGVVVFLLIWGAWQWPFYMSLGPSGVRGIYGGDVEMRFADTSLATVLGHLATYPFEVLACLLPWSPLLIAYFNREFRRAIGPARENVLFLAVCLAVTFPTCWLPPGARGRYYMPLYPCFAPLVGLVVDRCLAAPAAAPYRIVWPTFLAVMAGVMFAAAAGVLGLAWRAPAGVPAPSLGLAAAFAAGACLLAGAALWARRWQAPLRAVCGAAAVAAFAGLVWNGPVIEAKLALSETGVAQAVAELKAKLPPGAHLVSFGPTHHLFAYYYRDSIAQLPWPDPPAPGGPEPPWEYFCYATRFSECPPLEQLPYPYEQLAVISCERQRTERPERVVIVARRVAAE